MELTYYGITADCCIVVALATGKKKGLVDDEESSSLSKTIFCSAADAKNKTLRFTLFCDSE